MSVEALLKIPATLLLREPDDSPDPYGNPGWTETEQTTLCELQQTAEFEELGATVQATTFRVFLPADAPLRGWDALRLEDGTIYELAGDAALWTNPRSGVASHVEGSVRRVE